MNETNETSQATYPANNLTGGLDQFIGRRVRVYICPDSSFIWEDITEDIKPKISPEAYIEPFRPISPDEMACRRGRIPWTDSLAETPANLIQVSFTCNSKGTTQCIILCNHPDCTYIFIGIARLNPIDSFDRLKGQRLAYYRAVTESEAIALPVSVHFALAT